MSNGLAVIIVGAVLIAIGIAGLFVAMFAARRVRVMTATSTSRIGDLLPEYEALRGELGGGPSELRKTVELKGRVACDSPVTGELSGEAAAMVHTQVSRDVEVRKRTTDKNGRTTERWVRQTERIHSDERQARFDIDDGTGRVRVRPDGASIDLTEVVDRFEQPNTVEQTTGSLRLGGFSFNFSTSLGSSKRIIGYRFQESILPVGADLYVLGELSDTGDGLAVRDADDPDRPFIVSTKDEESLVRSGKSTIKWGKIGGGACVVLGLVACLIGAVMLILG